MSVFPIKHISIRVPWHDSGWNGTVCKEPARNTACLKLTNIAESKNEEFEERHRGACLSDLNPADLPPCVKERGTFMSNFALTRFHNHPYAETHNETHLHFRPTPLHFPAYSAAGLPFRWMNKGFVFGDDRSKGFVASFPLGGVNQDVEPTKEALGFQTPWLQDFRNHHSLLECFWNHVRPEESLVFFYAKQVPLVEDIGRRVLIGVGRVKGIGDLTEYEYEGDLDGKIRSLIWERMVMHSIRPDFADGFLLPYHEALERSEDGMAFDAAEVVAYAPDDHFEEFSYATEHVGHDAGISALLSCRSALLKANELFSFDSKRQEKWIDKELGRLWKKRGPFPGLGSILSATGVEMGNFIGQILVDRAGETGNPWVMWDQVLDDPKTSLPSELAMHVGPTLIKAWKQMEPGRRAFLELLSRIALSAEQADILAVPEVRRENGIEASDQDIILNPYLIYEVTRLTTSPVAIGIVDRGLFPTGFIREKFPIPEPSRIATAVDERRLRSLCIRELENAAVRGDTLSSRESIVTTLRRGNVERGEDAVEVTGDLLRVAEENFDEEIKIVEMADSSPAYQLGRFADVGDLLRNTVLRRIEAPRHQIAGDWRGELDAKLGSLPAETDERAREERAREEKAAALQEIAESRFSVLIGPAGTGKTTLLSVLCQHPEVSAGGIVLLAPTGKARVRMESMAREAGTQNYKAYTLAQFLSPTGRYDGPTYRYRLTGEEGDKVGRTVIIDECSMMTEEMMAALIEALSGVHRLILVGDPRQLPPIGAGRPFVDIITRLTPPDIEAKFPRVDRSYAELTVPRRQDVGERDDLQLASWYGGAASAPGEDQVFEILSGQRDGENIRFVQWDTPDELERMLPEVISKELGFDPNLEEWQAFAVSLGGILDTGGSAWFNVAWGDRPSAGKAAEAWQILCPVRQKPWGVDALNRAIHQRYKASTLRKAREYVKPYLRSIPQPVGEDQLVYGDKIINNRNWSVPKSRIYPQPDQQGYLANGEIGMIVGHRKTKKKNWFPDYLELEFSTQTGKVFKFYKSDFNDEGEARLDLAYALTVHKAQGSEFDKVFLILPKSPLMLTRELLYTALTRQKSKVIVLHQGSSTDLQKLSSERFSATAARLTNLFGAPKPVQIGDKFLEEKLIHVTSRGEAVRSKSEVIIANLLHSKKIHYHYETPLEIGGITKYPDFTIEDDDTGVTYYWEHCGMLSDPGYRRRWNEKREWYTVQNILPHEKGGGAKGTLIVTEDSPSGGISSQKIEEIINRVILKQP